MSTLGPVIQSETWLRPKYQAFMVLLYFHLCIATLYWMIAPIFGDLYKINPGFEFRYLIALPMAGLTALALPSFSKPSDFTLALLALISTIPTLSYFVVHDGSFIYVVTCWVGFLVYDLVRRVPLNLQINLEMRIEHVILLSLAMMGLVTVVMLQNFKINSLSAIAADIYIVRADIKENVYQISTIVNYIRSWTYTVITPFLILYFTMRRKWFFVWILIGLSVLFFFVLARKSILFDPFLALVVYLTLRNRKTFTILFIGVSIVVAIAAIEFFLNDTFIICGLLVRRTLFVPVMMNANYHEIFTELGHVYYSHSVLSFLSDYPFQLPYQSIVGFSVFGSTAAHANTGIFGTGFMHFGYPGVIIFAAIMGLIAAYIDNRPIARGHPSLTAAMITVPTYTIFTSADLFSGLLTNGLLLALLYCTICPHLSDTSPPEKTR